MTPQDLKDARERLGLTQLQLGKILGLGDPSRNVRRWEAGEIGIPGPAITALRYMLAYGLDTDAKIAAGIPVTETRRARA